MRLRRIEINGFKTFRDKVVLDFPPGVSGVIGPNGCGKSNIVDALRWVMGEQRVKALRGKKMDDVIFNGSENSPPLGMAEVTITMAGDAKPFSGSYTECSEVTITRRLFREMESEYFINKVPCRMLDVKEFFMDTGVGTKTYSLVEQNSVATLVEAKPEERRHFIEEAAGIAKYKSRKDAALRKMEATKQNLLRLHDIMKEVKTQLNSVSRQAKRAEQYKTLKKEIREMEIALALTAYSNLGIQRAALVKQLDEFNNSECEIKTGMIAGEAILENIKTTVMEEEESISQGREQLYERKNTIIIKEQGVEFSKSRIADLSAKRQRDLLEIKVREAEQNDISREMEALEAGAKETEDELQRLNDALTANERRLAELRKMEKFLSDELEERKIGYIDIAAEEAKLKNTESNLAKILEDIVKRKDRLKREMEEGSSRCDFLKESLRELYAGLKADEANREDLKRNQENLNDDLGMEEANLQAIEERISLVKQENERKSERLSSLQEFHEGYSWCSEGIKSIMTAGKQGYLSNMQGGSFLGLVADHIDVPREYETAVEAVLGEKLQYVVVKSQEDGIMAIDYLRSAARGRGTFVPLAVRNYGTDSILAEHLKEQVRLIDQVTVDEGFAEIIAYLLGDVLLIANLNAGVSLWRQNGFRGTFVTPEGDIINSQGILTGGYSGNGERGLLSDKRQIGELKQDIIRLAKELATAEEERKRTTLSIMRCEEEILQAKTDWHQLELRINGRRKDQERFEDELRRINQRSNILIFDFETLTSEEKDAQEKMAGAKKAQILLAEREKIVNDELAELKVKLDALKKELHQEEGVFTSAKINLAAREGKWESDRKTLIRLEASLNAIIRDINEKQNDTRLSYDKIAELTKNVAGELEYLTGIYHDCQEREDTLAAKAKHLLEQEERLKKVEMEVKEIKQRLEQILKEKTELDISLREISFQMDNLKKRIFERHQLDLDSISNEVTCLTIDQSRHVSEKIEKLKDTVDNFGDVNLLALNEYEELKIRFDFLTSQNADINASLNSLQHTIERINRISKARFAETFTAVRNSFREMFARMFPGGKGELYLTDSEDMLETGVEIDIQVPGKRTRNISLLSGGEKSLAAIALIFAILHYRPTPFLVLDEVDAALDDANIALFNKLIRDISNDSQIIIVTHNKKTMEAAQNLYGITMQTQGVSTLVSVSLN